MAYRPSVSGKNPFDTWERGGNGEGGVYDEGLLPLFSIRLIVRLSRVTLKGCFTLGVGG